MLSCEACGRPLSDDVLRCPACQRPVADATPDDAGQPPETPPARFAGAPDAPSEPTEPAEPAGEAEADWDSEETTRFGAVDDSRHNRRNTLAVMSLSVALVAAVVSLAWLIGQAVAARPFTPASGPAPVTATPVSSTPPRNAVVCTPEVARSTNTSCAVAGRVLGAVRTLGTDLPDKFRVTIVDPNNRRNATYLCAIKSWIECTGPRDAHVYVRRQV